MIGNLIEQLSVANTKLFELCNKKHEITNSPENFSKEDMVALIEKDIELCKTRANLKNKIDETLNGAIRNGGLDSIKEVKQYGSS